MKYENIAICDVREIKVPVVISRKDFFVSFNFQQNAKHIIGECENLKINGDFVFADFLFYDHAIKSLLPVEDWGPEKVESFVESFVEHLVPAVAGFLLLAGKGKFDIHTVAVCNWLNQSDRIKNLGEQKRSSLLQQQNNTNGTS